MTTPVQPEPVPFITSALLDATLWRDAIAQDTPDDDSPETCECLHCGREIDCSEVVCQDCYEKYHTGE